MGTDTVGEEAGAQSCFRGGTGWSSREICSHECNQWQCECMSSQSGRRYIHINCIWGAICSRTYILLVWMYVFPASEEVYSHMFHFFPQNVSSVEKNLFLAGNLKIHVIWPILLLRRSSRAICPHSSIINGQYVHTSWFLQFSQQAKIAFDWCICIQTTSPFMQHGMHVYAIKHSMHIMSCMHCIGKN